MEVMARYGGGGGAVGYGSAAADADADVAWKVGRIMLKYRPIAPKPVSGGGVAAGHVETKSSSWRGKRKGCMNEGRRGRKSTKKIAAAAVAEGGAFGEEQGKNKHSNNFSAAPSVITLPLMPVTPERKEESPATPTPSPTASDGHLAVSCFARPAREQVGTTTASSSSSNYCNNSSPSSSSVVVVPPSVSSCVTVECVTDMWREGDVQVAPLANATLLERDTCPVFVSDACDRVTWTNAAYRRMVVGPNEEEYEEEEEVMPVALVTKGTVPAVATCFTCRVRVRYACKRKGGMVSMAAPCDVWRLADGRLAWRLDVKAALSLSLGS